MAFKFIVLAALLAYAHAGSIGYSAPVYEEPLAYAGPAPIHAAPIAHAGPVAVAGPALAVATRVSDESFDPHPQYSYSYDVNDHITGDSKSQHEERDGDVVRGKYSLIEPDGTRRTVEYAADAHSGFNAIVHREPATHAIAAVGHHAPIAAPIAAPLPIAHRAPIGIAAHAGPLAYEAHGPAGSLAYEGHGRAYY